jgi:hypothetical protein
MTTKPPSEASTKASRPSYLQKLWVPLVIIIGVVIGEAISYVTTSSQEYGPPPGRFGYFPHFQTDPLLEFHIILTTVEVALLISLVVIYVRMYSQTRASFSLGLVVVLVALLVQTLLSYPLFIGYYGTVSLEPGLSSPSADIFTVCAYAVFLYLSLE